MVTLSNCLLVLGGNYAVDSVESLTLTLNRKHEPLLQVPLSSWADQPEREMYRPWQLSK